MTSPGASNTLASIAENAWDDIIEVCRSRLSEEDFQTVLNVGSLEGLIAHSKSLQEECQNDPRAYDIGRLNSFIAQLRMFNGTFENIIRTDASGTAPLWGSIQLVVELVQEGADVLRIIVDMFVDINYVLPRIDVYSKTLDTCSESLTRSTREIMLLIAEFACLVIVYYRENPIRNIVIITWTPFRPVFERIVSRIQQTARHIEFEAHALAMQDSTTRYEELKRLLAMQQISKPEPKSSCFCVSRPRNPKFVGRVAILNEMDAALNPRLNGVQKQTVYSLYGLGGVGKTQLALEYLYLHRADFPIIIWLSSETIPKLDQSVREATAKLGLVLEQEKETDTTARKALKKWLEETDVSWLLVFDNADQPKILQDYWPVAEHGSVLLTSRNPASARIRASGHPSKGRQITALDVDEGASLLLSLLQDKENDWSFVDYADTDPSEDTSALAHKLTEELGGLPLAIDQMASYILETGSSLASFLDLFTSFQNKSQVLLESSNPDLTLGYSHSISTVWEVSLSRVTLQGKHLLELLAFYDPDSIQKSLFLDGAQSLSTATSEGLGWLADKIQFMNASKSLFEQSLITQDKGHLAFVIHRLVRSVTLAKMDPTDRRARFNEAVHLIHNKCPLLSPDQTYLNGHWPTLRLYLPHILALENQYREEGIFAPTSELADILTSAAWYLMEQAQLKRSLEILETAKTVALATLSGNEFMAAQIFVLYGVIYVDVQDHKGAIEALQKSLEILKGTDDCDDLALAAGYNGYGVVSMSMGNLDIADTNFGLSIKLRQKHPSRNAGMLGIGYSNMACLRWAQGQYEDSLRFAEMSIPLCEDAYGVAGEKTAQPYWRKGNTLIKLRQLDDAFAAHMRSLDIRKEATPGGFKFAASLHKVAWIFTQQGDYASAEQLLSKALSIYEPMEGRKGEVARSKYLLATVLEHMGKSNDAADTKAKAAQLRKDLTGLLPDEDDNENSYDLLVSLLER